MKTFVMSLIFITLSVNLFSCGPSREELLAKGEIDKYGNRIESNSAQRQIATCRQVASGITIHIIDSCEYILVCDNGVSIIHKANCKNHK